MNDNVTCENMTMNGSMMKDENGQWQPVPDLMTQEEVIRFLRIPEISKAKNYRFVIEHLKRMHDLPCMHISRQPLYPRTSIQEWILRRSL